MLAYDRGGIEMKSFIGIHDAIFFGISFNVDHAVGKEKAEPNVPGVVAKLKFTDGWESFPISIAAGYDSFYMGDASKVGSGVDPSSYSSGDHNKMLYGPYLAVTKPIYLFDSEQYFSFGIRIPTQPDYVPKDASYFASFDLPLGKMFSFKAETERIYYNFKRHEDWLGNLGLRFNFMPNAGIDFGVIFQKDQKPNRIIKVEYSNAF
jgi:hypothetical protein